MDTIDPLDDLLDYTLQLELSDDETNPENAPTDSTKYPIIAKVLSEKTLNHNAIKSTLTKAWKIPTKTHINTIGPNTLVFLLDEEDDRHRIWSQSPWSFRGNLVVSRPWFPEEALDEVDLTKIQIWVQAIGLLVLLINRKVAEKIGNSIEKFVATDLVSENQRWRKALPENTHVQNPLMVAHKETTTPPDPSAKPPPSSQNSPESETRALTNSVTRTDSANLQARVDPMSLDLKNLTNPSDNNNDQNFPKKALLDFNAPIENLPLSQKKPTNFETQFLKSRLAHLNPNHTRLSPLPNIKGPHEFHKATLIQPGIRGHSTPQISQSLSPILEVAQNTLSGPSHTPTSQINPQILKPIAPEN
ncbi:hypothetical protein Salat_0633900 [Sesamum alatum]|uniref:DUF4283 domain-containing protein n=1 Tax=Sesamum alatum TaxID=300844 RepID=A0AAE1YR23_9LAMI|nr:hypothetical protein Salat_0633900 [Sesamum alatum]